jgi:hypothetical protein
VDPGDRVVEARMARHTSAKGNQPRRTGACTVRAAPEDPQSHCLISRVPRCFSWFRSARGGEPGGRGGGGQPWVTWRWWLWGSVRAASPSRFAQLTKFRIRVFLLISLQLTQFHETRFGIFRKRFHISSGQVADEIGGESARKEMRILIGPTLLTGWRHDRGGPSIRYYDPLGARFQNPRFVVTFKGISFDH